jgi:hypothetical protein
MRDEDVAVFVVWENVLASDVLGPSDEVRAGVADRRVRQFWDPDLRLSAHIHRSVNAAPARYGLDEPLDPDDVVWDFVTVFPAGARWGDDFPVPDYFGGPVIDAIDELKGALTRLLRRDGEPR